MSGWAFPMVLEPEVEYLTWPMADLPGSWDRTGASKMSETRPISRWVFIVSPSVHEMPALSCPLC